MYKVPKLRCDHVVTPMLTFAQQQQQAAGSSSLSLHVLL